MRHFSFSISLRFYFAFSILFLGHSDVYSAGFLVGVYLATLNFLSNMYLLREGARLKKRRTADAVSIEI